MKLHELFEARGLEVRVDQVFADALLGQDSGGFEYDFDQEYEDIAEVPEKLQLLVTIYTPTENDYRGAGPHADAGYDNHPECAAYVGKKTGQVYIRDMLNDPQTIVPIVGIDHQKFMQQLQQHVVTTPTPNQGSVN